jgi:hypothetical protein
MTSKISNAFEVAPDSSPRRNLTPPAAKDDALSQGAAESDLLGESYREEPSDTAWTGDRRHVPRDTPSAAALVPDYVLSPGRVRRQKHKQVHAQRQASLARHPHLLGFLVFLVLFTPIWISFGGAITNPSLGTNATARIAEWSRDHGAEGLVTWIENLYYSHHPPPIGGKPPVAALPTQPKGASKPGPNVSDRVLDGGLPVPAALVPFPQTPLAGEGRWVPAGRLVGGLAAVYTTFMRPDAVHTSVVDGVAWMDTRLLSVRLYSGNYIPGGGPYKYNTPLGPSAEPTLVAAFNGGFRLDDSQGGYFTDGVTVRPLVVGAASFVIYDNGMATVGAWGTEVKMSPDVFAVRQELRLLVDNGRPAPGLATNQGAQWGTVLGNSIYVSRSGIGVTKDGALVYVGGPSLDALDLARLLVRAGAVRAMELDINSAWVNLATFDPSAGGLATPANARDLLPSADMSGAYRYFASYWERDFFTLSARPQPLGTAS